MPVRTTSMCPGSPSGCCGSSPTSMLPPGRNRWCSCQPAAPQRYWVMWPLGSQSPPRRARFGSVDIVYRVAGLRPSPATAASYAHIFAGRAIHVRSDQPWPRSVGSSRRALPDGSGFDLPVCDPLVISRWLESTDVSGYVAAPAAGVTRHLARVSSAVLRRQLARRLLQSGYRRLVSGEERSGALTVDAIASTSTERTAFRSDAPDLYFTTSAAAAAVASRLADGSSRAGGLTAPTQVLGDLDAGVLAGLRISCTPLPNDERIAS